MIHFQAGKVNGSQRNHWALTLAAGGGLPFGIFLIYTAADPWGAVMYGLFAATAGSIIITAALCLLATNFYGWVGVSFSGGAALGAVITKVAMDEIKEWQTLPLMFALVFGILMIPAGLTASLCALLKWEDKRARAREFKK